MNWGHKIAILYGAFACLIMFMVYKAMQEDVSLVTPDYYTQTLTYQDEINQRELTFESGRKPLVESMREAEQITVTFPVQEAITGKVWLYRPSDSEQDVHETFSLAVGEPLILSMKDKPFGLWRIKVNFKAAGKDYLTEQVITY
jgi:hypothetical protein